MLTPLSALWLPILLAAVTAFIASAIMWTVMPHHRTDFKQIPDEESVLAAMRAGGLQPGAYMFPYCATHGDQSTPEHQEKMKEGPLGTMIVMQNGMPSMAPMMVQQFIFFLLTTTFIAYIGAVVLEPGTDYLRVFRVIGTAAALTYAGAHAPQSIWFQRPWANTFKEIFDGVVYGLLMAGVFGWLWPR
jgi:hypothetical protein